MISTKFIDRLPNQSSMSCKNPLDRCNALLFSSLLHYIRIGLGLQEDIVQTFFEDLSKIVVPEYIDESYVKILETLDIMNYTTERLMFEVMRPCKEMIHNCTWLGSQRPCEDLFKVATSSEGFCCSFNYKPPLDPKLMYFVLFIS